MAKAKTIQLKQGAGTTDYAKVSARVAEFHKANKQNTILTSYEFKEGFVIFKATVTSYKEDFAHEYTGHSFGKIGALKAFEKLETIAVGRALAFAGFLSDGEIASNEEMVKYEEQQSSIDPTDAIKAIKEAKSLEELQTVWKKLKPEERADKEVELVKNNLKEEFESFNQDVAEEIDTIQHEDPQPGTEI